MNRSCGDLVFSSHVTFTLAFALTFRRYGPGGRAGALLKAAAFAAVAAFSLLVVASRKHYSVDVVVAWCARELPRCVALRCAACRFLLLLFRRMKVRLLRSLSVSSSVRDNSLRPRAPCYRRIHI